MMMVGAIEMAAHGLVIARLHVVLMNVLVILHLLDQLRLFALRTVQTVRTLLLLDLLMDQGVQHALVMSIDRVTVGVAECALLLTVQRATGSAQRVTGQFGVLRTAKAVLSVCTISSRTLLFE